MRQVIAGGKVISLKIKCELNYHRTTELIMKKTNQLLGSCQLQPSQEDQEVPSLLKTRVDALKNVSRCRKRVEGIISFLNWYGSTESASAIVHKIVSGSFFL